MNLRSNGLRATRRKLLGLGVLGLVTAVLTGPAAAGVALGETAGTGVVDTAASSLAASCDFDSGTATLTISIPEDGSVSVIRDLTGDIVVSGSLSCSGLSDVTNTDSIVVKGDPDGDETLTIDLSGGKFAPGMTDEPDATDEIEWQVDLDGGSDNLIVNGSDGNDIIRFGAATGANFSNDGDADVSLAGIDQVTVNGGKGGDVLHGLGAFGSDTSGRWPGPMLLNGGPGADKLTGGDGPDRLVGAADNDNMYAVGQVPVGGHDGADQILGGNGTDSYYYNLRNAGVTVTIGDGLANDGANGGAEGDDVRSDVERVYGSKGGDNISAIGLFNNLIDGGAGDDILAGGLGNDRLVGGTGGDSLSGQDGNDDLRSKDGVAGNDSNDGGNGTDACARDTGTPPNPDDSTVNCETLS